MKNCTTKDVGNPLTQQKEEPVPLSCQSQALFSKIKYMS